MMATGLFSPLYHFIKIRRFILTIINNLYKKLNHPVFLPPFVLLILAMIVSLTAKDTFLELVNGVNQWILTHFDWLFSYTSFAMLLLCICIFFSPIGKVKIGGTSAEPILNRWRWFSIIICTTIAVGILFWGASEPIYHISNPPQGIKGDAKFAMSSVFMHWSLTPYAIYTIPALLFALGYYNHKGNFSLGTMLFPFKRGVYFSNLFSIVDSICLFALIAGMAAVLGVGMLTIAGGLSPGLNAVDKSVFLGIIAILMVASFTISAATGLLKGIRILSGINIGIFIFICVFVFIAGPTLFIVQNAYAGLKSFFINLVPHSLSLGPYGDKQWMHSWTTFYWANWMAWAPITALFLGKIGYGYTVRQFILFNWLIPAGFGILWISVFSGTSLFIELNQLKDLSGALFTDGPDSVIHIVLDYLPLTKVLSALFLFTVFLSYITAADSNTEAMSSISSKDMLDEKSEPPKIVKYMWGVLIGFVAWIMVSYTGVEGVKMLSNLGGLPALFLMVLLCAAVLKMLFTKVAD